MDDSTLDRHRARTIAGVQCAATVAALALFAIVDAVWYVRLVPGLLVVLIANAVVLGIPFTARRKP
jgi:F0F1-type ATP synthase assembly protein I